MFFGLCLWATRVVIDSMTPIAGQEGWFKTERPNPPIVSFAKDRKIVEEHTMHAKIVSCEYAETLANYQEKPDNSLLESNRTTDSFLVCKAHNHKTSSGEEGVIVHNTHKQTGISYITFLFGKWSNLNCQLDKILLEFHNQYQAVFPTASQSVIPISSPFKLPTQGVNRPVTELEGLPFDQVISDWNKFDQQFKMDIIREAIYRWDFVWKDEQKYKPTFEILLHEFVTSPSKSRLESDDNDNDDNDYDQKIQIEFLGRCVRDLKLTLFSQQSIAMPMFLMCYWDLFQPKQEDRYDARINFRGDLVVAILMLGQRDDLGGLKDLYITPLLQGVYGKISDISLNVLFESYRNFSHEVFAKQFNSPVINRVYLSALRRSFMDLLSRCTARMEQEMDQDDDSETPWYQASRIAGMQANRQFLLQYKENCNMEVFTRSLPFFLASEVWTDLPEWSRKELFSQAAYSDKNLAFVRLYRDDQSIDSFTKSCAFHKANEKKYLSSSKPKAPQIASLLAEWKDF